MNSNHMEAVKADTWKELEQAEIPEKSAKKFESSKGRWGINNNGHDMAESLIHQHWKHMEKLDQRRINPTELWSIRDNTPSKMSMWWQSSTCSTKVTSSSYKKFDAQMKLNEWMIPTISFSIKWFIILLAGVISLKIKSKCWLKWEFWLWKHKKATAYPLSWKR